MRLTPCVLLTVACAGESGVGSGSDSSPEPATTPGLAISGTWIDEAGGEHTFAEVAYQHAPPVGPAQIYGVVSYDNDLGWIAGINDAGNLDFPDLWSRFDFEVNGDIAWLCHTVPDGPTQPYAEQATSADFADVPDAGCLGGPWQVLTR